MKKSDRCPLPNVSLSPSAPIAVARRYVAHGWMPIPVPHRSKNPGVAEWQNLRITDENVDQFFGTRASNVGVLLGDTSGGLVDVDLDCAEAIGAAPFLLPGTTMTFGRKGRPKSHYLYVAGGSASLKLLDPTEPEIEIEGTKKKRKTTIIELRSTGLQTVFPGSTHTSGEAVEWSDGIPTHPTTVDAEGLARAVCHTAAASLLARHWPNGARQDTSLALAGALLRDNWPSEKAENFVNAVAVAADDEEVSKRIACVRATKEKLARGEEVTGWPSLTEALGVKIVTKVKSWLGSAPTTTKSGHDTDDAEQEGGQRKKQADVLVQLARDRCTFFHDSADTAYARTNDGEVLRLQASKRFRSLLDKLYFDAHQSTTGNAAKTDALATLEGIAIHGSPRRPVFVRVGVGDAKIYIDLANDEHEVIEIGPSGWAVLTNSPVHFFRARGMLPLPRPVAGGDLNDLYEFLNVGHANDFVLIVSWLVAALRSQGPYPILVLQGRHGSAKSTTARVLRALTDPNLAPIRTPPREPRDLAIAAQNAQVLAFDNLSGVSDWLSDAMCRVSTGGGFATRELYTDGEEKIFSATRPIVLNGIDDLLGRPDLADRALMITLPEISPKKRRDEKGFWRAFNGSAPHILGALLDGLSRALRDEPTLTLETTPRMADFVRWASAALPAFGLSSKALINALARSKAEATAVALEGDPLAHAVLDLLNRVSDRWAGTASELLAALLRDARDTRHELPRAANTLTNRLRRLAPMLREVGVYVAESRTAGERRMELVRKREGSSSPSGPSPTRKTA